MPRRDSYPAETLRAVRRRYEGDGLGPAEAGTMVVEAIAEAFDLHPNTIWTWKQRDGWCRPDWWRDIKRPHRRRPAGGALRDLGDRVLAALEAAVGLPCPTNVVLGRALGASAEAVRHRLRALKASGRITVERDGAHRRVVLADGRATDWTVHHGQEDQPLACERRSPSGQDRGQDRPSRMIEILRRVAAYGHPCPSSDDLARRLKCSRSRARRIFVALADAGAFTVERRPGLRRVVFPDGCATAWPGGGKGTDLVAADAVRALQRMGCHVFDVAVVAGRAWGVSWSVDGKTLGRAELIALAAGRRSAAMQSMQVAS